MDQNTLDKIAELEAQLSELKGETTISTEQEIEEEKKRNKISKYLSFNNNNDEDKFYNKIKTNKQTLKKLYNKCYKHILFSEKEIKQKNTLMERHLQNKYNNKYNLDIHEPALCGDYYYSNKQLREINMLEDFNQRYKYYGDLILDKTIQQQKSRWKKRLMEMEEDNVELQLFNLFIKLDKERWDNKRTIAQIEDIYDIENCDKNLCGGIIADC